MAAKTAKITKQVVDKLEPDSIVWDTEIKGFCVRRQATAKVYCLKYRINGKQRWETIGKHGSPWSPNEARSRARELLLQVKSGIDVAAQRKVSSPLFSVKDAARIFLKEHVEAKLKSSTRYEYTRLLTSHILPELGHIDIDTLSKSDVSQFHAKRASTSRTANHCLAVLKKLFNWAQDRGLAQPRVNPCNGVEQYKQNAKERYLSDTELVELGKALAQYTSSDRGNIYVAIAIKLLLLTGARRNEILGVRWDEVDFDHAVLRLGDSKTGQKIVHLNSAAVDILKGLPRIDGNPYVLPGKRPGCHLANIQKPWSSIRRKAGLANVRLHDLRHTFASRAIMSGVPVADVGKLLGHKQMSTTQRYAHFADEHVKKAAEKVGHGITAALSEN